MPFLQEVLHKLELGGGMRYVRRALAVMAVLLLVVGYNWRAFRNMATQEAMDMAQLGRNIAQGKGYTTLFVRPFSIYLVKQRNRERGTAPAAGKLADPGELRGMHPDLANPPVYPVVLAALMKVLPFDYTASSTVRFWSSGGRFWWFEPDFLIAVFNQLLLLASVALVFFLARRLFDSGVAWLSAGLVLGMELLWRFSVSGLSTMLLLVIFLGLTWCVVLLEEETRVPKWGPRGVLVLAGLTGAMVGLGGLTRYSFGWLIIPVLAYLVLFGGQRRVALVVTALAAFAALMAPWVARNYRVSGKSFGTATYAAMETTFLFPENRLERSLEPDLRPPDTGHGKLYLAAYWLKLENNLRQIVTEELPRLGGSWVTAFFLVGLMIGFRKPAITRLRYFLMGCMAVLILAEALGRTQLSEASPEINSENLLVLVAPLVLVFGVSLFFLLLDQIRLPFLELRPVVIGVFALVVCLPMCFVFLPPKAIPVAYPPYYPPAIQTMAGWLKGNELAMSDIPWAVAWYGQRQCVWLTLKCAPDAKDPATHEDFFAINDFQKPINALYLTPETMDARFLSQWFRAGEQSWGSFVVESVLKRKVPDQFPLREAPTGWPSDQLVLTDWPRWKKP
jgi:4-amino-4-deoxy-L-arabinose transferase-like glycosyltransferase